MFGVLVEGSGVLRVYGKEPARGDSSAAPRDEYRVGASTSIELERTDKKKAFLFVRNGANFIELTLKFGKLTEAEDWHFALQLATTRTRFLAHFRGDRAVGGAASDPDWSERADTVRSELVARCNELNQRLLTAALDVDSGEMAQAQIVQLSKQMQQVVLFD